MPAAANVHAFHEAFDLARPTRPTVPSLDLSKARARRLLEEAAEVIGAQFDLPEQRTRRLAQTFTYEAEKAQLERECSPFPPRVDLALVAKELADLLYSVYGSGVAFGLPLNRVLDAVHASNMTKEKGDGEHVLKGDAYEPAEPTIRRLLHEAA